MEEKQNFWPIMLYYFKKGKNTTEMQKKICVAYGEGAVTDWNCQKWGFVLEISHWTMIHSQVDQLKLIAIETLIEKNQRYTRQEIANILKISKSSVENHLHQLGYVNHFDVWVHIS